MATTKKLDMRVDDNMYEQIVRVATKQNTTVSGIVRKMIDNDLQKALAIGSVDFIRDQIHEEIKATCFPQFDRVAKLEAKIGYQSVASFYLLAYIMDNILPSHLRKDFDDIKQKERLMAISYLRLNTNDVYEFLNGEDRASKELKL